MALAAAGYALLLAIRQAPVGAGDPARLTQIPVLPEPSRLPRRPAVAPASSPTRGQAFVPERHSLGIEVTGLPDPWLATAGVAIYDPLESQCAWLPLAGVPSRDGVRFVSGSVPAGSSLRITVARNEASARTGYWLSTDVGSEAATARLRLAVPVQQVLVLGTGIDKALGSALRLRRVSDPRWLPIEAQTTAPSVDAGNLRLPLLLGPGDYELAPWTGTAPPLRLSVPGPAEVVATFAR